jgi:hypothetical protein
MGPATVDRLTLASSYEGQWPVSALVNGAPVPLNRRWTPADPYPVVSNRRENTVALRLAVLGTGYLGATHAACMAELGYDVLGMDFDADKVASLTDGEAPFFEPGLNEVIKRNVDAGRLRFTTSY